MVIMLSSWHSHCDSSPCSFDEYIGLQQHQSKQPPILRPSQRTWAVKSTSTLLSSTSTISTLYCHSARCCYSCYCLTEGRRLSGSQYCCIGYARAYSSGFHDKQIMSTNRPTARMLDQAFNSYHLDYCNSLFCGISDWLMTWLYVWCWVLPTLRPHLTRATAAALASVSEAGGLKNGHWSTCPSWLHLICPWTVSSSLMRVVVSCALLDKFEPICRHNSTH